MSKTNYVYVAKTNRITDYGVMLDESRIFKDLTSFLNWMELYDLVFFNKDQVERIKHGDSAVFRSNKKAKKNFTIGEVEVEKFY